MSNTTSESSSHSEMSAPAKSFIIRHGGNTLDKELLYFVGSKLYMERNGKRLDGIRITGDIPEHFKADFWLQMGWTLTIWPEFVIESSDASLARKGIQSHCHLNNYFNKYVLGSRPTDETPSILESLFVAEGWYKGNSLHDILYNTFHTQYWGTMDTDEICTDASEAHTLAMSYPTFEEIEAMNIELIEHIAHSPLAGK